MVSNIIFKYCHLQFYGVRTLPSQHVNIKRDKELSHEPEDSEGLGRS